MDDNDLDICGCANHVVVPTQRVNEGSLWHVKVLNISYWPFLVTYNQNLATETESMSGIKAISYMPEKRILYFHLGKWVGHLVKLFPIFNLKFHKSQVSWNWYWKYLSMFHFTYFRYFQDLFRYEKWQKNLFIRVGPRVDDLLSITGRETNDNFDFLHLRQWTN